jgi:hypothetical protein
MLLDLGLSTFSLVFIAMDGGPCMFELFQHSNFFGVSLFFFWFPTSAVEIL